MALVNANTTATSNNNGQRKQAHSFVNIYLPVKNGTKEDSKRKIGFIALDIDNPTDAKLIARLESGGEEALAAMKEALIIDFRLNNTDGSEYDF